MKHLVVLLLSLLATSSLFAQQRRAVYAEVWGLSNTFSVAYDARFHGHKGLGFSIGLSHGGTDSPFDFLSHQTYKTDGVAVPLELNTLIGGKRHFLDLGVGISLGYYQSFHQDDSHLDYSSSRPYSNKSFEIPIDDSDRNKQKSFGYFCAMRASYRYQAPKGLFLRVGLSVISGLGKNKWSVGEETNVVPHLALGLSF